MGYIIAWLLSVPVTLLVLFWLFFGRSSLGWCGSTMPHALRQDR